MSGAVYIVPVISCLGRMQTSLFCGIAIKKVAKRFSHKTLRFHCGRYSTSRKIGRRKHYTFHKKMSWVQPPRRRDIQRMEVENFGLSCWNWNVRNLSWLRHSDHCNTNRSHMEEIRTGADYTRMHAARSEHRWYSTVQLMALRMVSHSAVSFS